MEQNSVTNSSNAGANLRKEDIRQMIERQDMNEEVQKHFGFLWQILTFSILDSFRSSATVKDGVMQYSFDLKPNYIHSQNSPVMPNIKDILGCILYIITFMMPHPLQQDVV